jgi:hypothetical protein
MVELALSGGYAIPDRTLTDLRSAALGSRGTAREPLLRTLIAKALAARGDMEAEHSPTIAMRVNRQRFAE